MDNGSDRLPEEMPPPYSRYRRLLPKPSNSGIESVYSPLQQHQALYSSSRHGVHENTPELGADRDRVAHSNILSQEQPSSQHGTIMQDTHTSSASSQQQIDVNQTITSDSVTPSSQDQNQNNNLAQTHHSDNSSNTEYLTTNPYNPSMDYPATPLSNPLTPVTFFPANPYAPTNERRRNPLPGQSNLNAAGFVETVTPTSQSWYATMPENEVDLDRMEWESSKNDEDDGAGYQSKSIQRNPGIVEEVNGDHVEMNTTSVETPNSRAHTQHTHEQASNTTLFSLPSLNTAEPPDLHADSEIRSTLKDKRIRSAQKLTKHKSKRHHLTSKSSSRITKPLAENPNTDTKPFRHIRLSPSALACFSSFASHTQSHIQISDNAITVSTLRVVKKEEGMDEVKDEVDGDEVNEDELKKDELDEDELKDKEYDKLVGNGDEEEDWSGNEDELLTLRNPEALAMWARFA